MTEAERYFETLFAPRPAGSLIAVSFAARGWKADFYDEAAQAAAACAGAVDVYARVTPLRERPRDRRGRGGAELSAALLAMWVELDIRGMPDGRGGIKQDGFDSLEHAIEVGSSVLPPAMVIASGGGVHVYVVLSEPLIITRESDLARATELVQRYQLAVKQAAGDVKIDSTHDLARVLRPAGTFNGKGTEPRAVNAIGNGKVETIDLAAIEVELPALETAARARKTTGQRRTVTVDEDAVSAALREHPGLETLVRAEGGDPSAEDFALACAAARDGLEVELIEQLVAHRLVEHGDPKGKSRRRDYIPRTIERAREAVARETRDEQQRDPLQEASTVIGMQAIPIIAAEERRSGRIVLERVDALVLRAPSLEALAKYDRLTAALAAGFGHELLVEKGKGASTAMRFVAALRRHFGPGHVRTLEEQVEAWLVDLIRLASELDFEPGEEKASVWKEIDETEPDVAITAPKFAELVLLAHDTTTHERYLRANWAQEYLRRCGWRNGLEEAVDMLIALGLEQPNADGRVRGGTIQMRFWVIPPALFERWSTW